MTGAVPSAGEIATEISRDWSGRPMPNHYIDVIAHGRGEWAVQVMSHNSAAVLIVLADVAFASAVGGIIADRYGATLRLPPTADVLEFPMHRARRPTCEF